MIAHNAVFALMYSACYLCTDMNICWNKSILDSSSISIKYVSEKCVVVIYLITIAIVMLLSIQATNKDHSEKQKRGGVWNSLVTPLIRVVSSLFIYSETCL